jgi:hypothetical protein
MEVAGLQVVPLPPSFPLQIHRSALASVEPSIALSTITNIKTTEVPLVLRARVFGGIAGVKDLQQAWPFSELGLL